MKKIVGILVVIGIIVMASLVVTLYSCGGSGNSSNSNTPAYTGTPAALYTSTAINARTLSELEHIQQAIASEGKNWVAGTTTLSVLSKEERQYYLGGEEPAHDNATMVFTQDNTNLAASFDWRNNNGANYVTPVKNQAWNYLMGDNLSRCGSCWAFSTTAALESQVQIKTNSPGSNINLSEQIVVSCSGAGNCSKGGDIYKTSKFLRDNGTLGAYCFQYQAQQLPCSQACPDWFQNNVQRARFNSFYVIGDNTTVTNCDANSRCGGMKSAIAKTGPIVIWMRVYSDLLHYKSGIYSRVSSATMEGGHYVLVVGYNNDGQYFIVKNSWGTDWGESGFFRIAYDMVWDFDHSDPTSKVGVHFGKMAYGYN
ncbi:MAG: hypothetical protein HQL01_01580 [Nitrospirae bacterium]|nr:hypothetical protein [Nitrospirota bacterium]